MISITNNFKVLTFSLIFTLCSVFGFSQDDKTKGQTITVTINNVKNDTGKVMVSLHNKDTFMKGPGLQNTESIIKDGKVTITFKNVVSGEYAIMTLHDENENHRMDFETNGMPKESYGISNNPMSYGPPQYDAAKFNVVSEDLNFNIRF